MPITEADLREGIAKALIDNGDGTFTLRSSLVTGDLEIGAVEIKNATDDTRAVVGANGLYVDVRAVADVDIDDISKGTQTNDVKVTLDSEAVVLGAGSAAIGSVQIKDTSGAELDFRQENENVNAADHGILIFGRDYASTPDKYRMIRTDASGYLETRVEGTGSDYLEPHTEDFDTGGGTDNTSSFGIAFPASGGSAVCPGDATNGLTVNLGSNNDVTLATLPDTASGDLAAMVVDLAAIEVLLGTMDADTSSLAGCVAGTELQVDVVSQPALAAATDSVAIYGSDDGGTTKRIIKTDSGGAIQVDLEVASVGLTGSLPDTAAGDLAAQTTDLAAIEVLLGTMDADTSAIAGCVGGSELQVDIVSGSVGLTGNLPDTSAGDLAAMVVDLAAIEVLLGTIDADTSALAGAVSGSEVQVDVVAALPAGSNLIGEVDTKPIEPSNFNSVAYAASHVIKASAGTCYEIRGYNSGASDQWVQVHDASSLPADTAVPEDIVHVPAGTNFSITYPQGKSFATGIVVCNSSTGPTKTIGAADCWFSGEYI